ncbi:MAG: NADP-dependent oxidoreductase [Acidimicrobiia bacterium]
MTSNTEIPATMKAICLHPPGGVDAVSFDEVATPIPAEGEVLVRVHAAALTRDELDWPVDRLPAIPSYELSGVVVTAGDGPFEAGQAVYALTDFGRDGVAAEYTVVPVGELALKPDSLSHVEAAALPLPALSAMQGLFDHGRLVKNERVLIHGGAGGVGGYAVQLARLHDAYVIATASTGRVATVHELGADEVVDHTTSDFTTIEPVDLVFDTAGGDRLTRSVDVLERGGRLVSVAEEPPREEYERAGVEGSYYLVASRPDQLAELTRLVDKGLLRVVVDRIYPLGDAGRAFEHLQKAGGRGKVVLSVGDDT